MVIGMILGAVENGTSDEVASNGNHLESDSKRPRSDSSGIFQKIV